MGTTALRSSARDTVKLGRREGVTVLTCDVNGCLHCFDAGLVHNRGGTRLVAGYQGWSTRYLARANAFRDYCPEHARHASGLCSQHRNDQPYRPPSAVDQGFCMECGMFCTTPEHDAPVSPAQDHTDGSAR